MELARVKLRGAYALLAGLLLLFAVPLYESIALTPLGYGEAVKAVVLHQDFRQLLDWITTHSTADRVLRLIQLLPFLLAVTVPPSLRRVLWPQSDRRGRVAALAGIGGFGLGVVATVLGIVTSAAAANSSSASPAATQTNLDHFVTGYVIETLLARVLGGALLTVFVVLASVRIVQLRPFPRLLGYVGLAVAALLAATALFLALAPAQAEVSTSVLATLGLALWLAGIGALLLRLRRLPTYPLATPTRPTAPVTP